MATEQKASTTQDIIDHLVHSIMTCEKSDDPFSHIYVQNCFPADVYARMITSFPDPFLYHPMDHRDARRPDGTSTRGSFTLSGSGDLDRLPAEDREFWRSVAEAIQSPAVRRAAFTQLRKDLAARLNVPESDVHTVTTITQLKLLRDTTGYEIKIHPDSTDRVITFQFYLPADMGQVDLGTSLYRELPAGPWKRFLYLLSQSYHLLPSALWRELRNRLFAWGVEQRRFVKARTHEFRPNSAGAFAVSHKSWHGRDRLRDDAGDRNTMMLQYNLKGQY
jgi:hypothetical protein